MVFLSFPLIKQKLLPHHRISDSFYYFFKTRNKILPGKWSIGCKKQGGKWERRTRPMLLDRKILSIGGAAILCFAVLLMIMIITHPIPQSQSYHHFADHRTLFSGPTPKPSLLTLYTLFSFQYHYYIKILLLRNS